MQHVAYNNFNDKINVTDNKSNNKNNGNNNHNFVESLNGTFLRVEKVKKLNLLIIVNFLYNYSDLFTIKIIEKTQTVKISE